MKHTSCVVLQRGERVRYCGRVAIIEAVADFNIALIREVETGKPPPLADFLLSLIPLKHRGNLPGDLEEDYWNRFLPRHGVKAARFLYWVHVLYAVLGFLARPLAGVAGLAWFRKFIEEIIYRMMR